MSICFFFSSRRRHTRFDCDWSSDVCSSDLDTADEAPCGHGRRGGPRSERDRADAAPLGPHARRPTDRPQSGTPHGRNEAGAAVTSLRRAARVTGDGDRGDRSGRRPSYLQYQVSDAGPFGSGFATGRRDPIASRAPSARTSTAMATTIMNPTRISLASLCFIANTWDARGQRGDSVGSPRSVASEEDALDEQHEADDEDREGRARNHSWLPVRPTKHDERRQRQRDDERLPRLDPQVEPEE